MKKVFILDRKEVIDLLSKKLNGDLKIYYDHLAVLTNYSKRQLIRLSKSLNEKGIDSTLKHGNKGLAAHNRASNDEIDFIVNFKKLYPNITIAQFRDIYLEDIIFNPSRKEDVSKYNLKPRSISFFQRLSKEYKRTSPVKHRSHKRASPLHLLREKVLELVCLFKSMELLLTGLATVNALLFIWPLTMQPMISFLAGLPKTNACMDIVR